MARLTSEQADEIADRYVAGEGIRALSAGFHTSDAVVKRVLAEREIPLRPHNFQATSISPETVAEMVRRYRGGEGISALAKSYRIGILRVRAILESEGVDVRPQNMTKFPPEVEVEIVRRYQAGESGVPLSKAFGCSWTTIFDILRRHGIQKRRPGNAGIAWTDDQIQEIVARWEGGESQASIAASFGVVQTVISRVLKTAGVETRRRVARGERHGSWKGGRHLSDSGYWFVMVPPDSPFASMRNRMGYVLEHRLVMAQALGRPLERHEHVHHKDGDRTNNAPENLQLVQTRHGRGVVYRCRCCGSTDVEAVEIEKP